MAIATTVADADLVTLKEASALLRGTPHPASVTTIRRWIDRYGLRVTCAGKAGRVSFSDILEAQRDEARRLGVI